MCDLLRQLMASADKHGVSRRTLLRGAGATAAAGGLTLAGTGTAAAGTARRGSTQHRTRIVMLGTAGGPILVNDRRAGISTAVVFENRVYLVDLGHRAPTQLVRSGITGTDQQLLSDVRAICFTHMHSDHVAEWPALYGTGVVNTSGDFPEEPIRVFGPGDRKTPARVFPPSRPEPELVNPENPSPGISAMTGYLRQAFAADFNDRIRDNNMPHPDRLFQAQDIDISPYWTVDEQGVPPILTEGTRIPVWEDGEVTITATLVDHRPTAPAFAYRFDTPDGSVVISGDTAPSANLIDLANGADYLVHEVIDAAYVDELVATLAPDLRSGVRQHLLESHTTIEQVGRDVAEVAGVKNLVLTHLVPANNPVSRWRAAQQGFSGSLTVGEDLMQLGVSRARS